MKTSIVAFGLSLLLKGFFTHAQTLPAVIQAKTPETAAFNKRIETPVALYTGVPNISIPLCEATTKGMAVPITLDYHAGGIQVEQEATWVGLGWNLNYGGQISRKQRGAPDEDYFFESKTSQISYYLGLPTDDKDNTLQLRANAINNAKHGLDDYLPDEFYYAMPGYSGRFMYGQQQRDFVLFPKEDIQIKRISNSNRTINSWKLRNPNGAVVEYGQDGRVSQTTAATGKTVSTSWNIKRITDIYKQSITYNYAPYSYGSIKAASESAFRTIGMGSSSASDGQIQYGIYPLFTYHDALPDTIAFPGGTIIFTTIAREDIAAPGQALSTITVTNSTGQVVKTIRFTYSYFYGDAFGTFTNTLLPKSYSYKRLRLDAITVVNAITPTQSQTYRFDYYLTSQLPSKYSYAQDHWGYYNGINNQHLLPNLIPEKFTGGDRRVVPSQAIAFSLKSIQYPEGGKTKFIYGSNTAQAPTYPRMAAYHDDTHFTEHEQYLQISGYNRTSFYAAGSTPVSERFNRSTRTRTFRMPFTIGEGSFPHIGFSWLCNTNFGLSSADNKLPNCTFNTVEFRLERIGPNNTRTIVNRFNTGDQHCAVPSILRKGQDSKALYADVSDLPVYKNLSTGQPILSTSTLSGDGLLYGGSYEMILQINNAGVDSLSEQKTYNNNHNTFFSVQWRQLNSQDNILYAGGLRVDTIKYYDSNGALLRKRAYSYETPVYARGTGSAPTSGRFASFPSYIQNTIRVGNDQFEGISYGKQYTSSSVVPLETTASSICGYEYVTESDIDVVNAANKLTSISHFSFNPPYYSYFYPLNGLTAIEPNEWTRGKLLDKQYLKTGVVIKKEEYSYYDYSPHLTTTAQEDYVQELNTDLLSFSLYGVNRSNHVFDFCDNINNNKCTTYYGLVDGMIPGMVPSTYVGQGQNTSQYINVAPYQSRVPYFERHTAFDKPLSKTITQYDDAGHSFVEQEKYFYEKTPALHQLTTTQKLLSINDTLRTLISYALDDNSVTGKALVAQHRLTVPIKQQSFKNRQLLATTSTTYQLRADSLVLPELTQTSQGLSPLVTSERYLAYDALGNLTRAQLKLQPASAYIWGYNGQYPIAEVVAAGKEAVAYASFETGETGNWTIRSQARNNAQAYTGQQSYNLTNGDIISPLLKTNVAYLISYWTTNSQPLANLGNSAVVLRKVKDWTLYQHTVTGITSLVLSGNGLVDDLRLLPVGAQMTTLTYQPLVGISSKTGPDNRTVFYEYDGLQRLQRVIDEQGRILSVNAHHYAQY